MKIVVAGAGSFGTAMAIALSKGGAEVTLLGRDKKAMSEAEQSRTMPRPEGCHLPPDLRLSSDPATMSVAQIVLICVPSQALGRFLSDHAPHLGNAALVACCKGIDLVTLTGPTGLISSAIGDQSPSILTGPSFAADIAEGLPTALTLACTDAGLGARLQDALSTPSLRLYRSEDPLGAELGGALKNVVAIACGACIGAGLGDSARAALMTRGFSEMQRMAQELGARPETLTGLSGLGDLALTCTSDLSRNYRYGMSIGRGMIPETGTTVEGRHTARAIVKLARQRGIDLPVMTAVDGLVDGRITVGSAMDQLLARPLRAE
jgi:glycerol-3-phosphate dehydrogenase (NAD(P)+)